MVIKAKVGQTVEGCKSTKIYRRVECRGGKRMKPENRVWFSSAVQARSAGYRACKVCKPDLVATRK